MEDTTTKRFSIKNWLRNWLLILFVALLGYFFGVSLDTTGGWDFSAGFDALLSTFGGLTSFGALLGTMAIVAGVVWGVRYMIKTDFKGHKTRERLFLIGTLATIFFVGVIGWSWIQMPSGTGWTTLGFLVVPGLLALLFRNVRTKSAGPSRRLKLPSFRRNRTRGRHEEGTTTIDAAPAPYPV